jgi:hypothetical protein
MALKITILNKQTINNAEIRKNIDVRKKLLAIYVAECQYLFTYWRYFLTFYAIWDGEMLMRSALQVN